MRLEGDEPVTVAMKRHPAGELFMAWLPYLLLVVFVLAWGDADDQGRHRSLDQQSAAGVAPEERRDR